jgi:2-polyprenyl-3-methyl-5-hydroxy-6-metoxy-1,4-benzoquinol methylase
MKLLVTIANYGTGNQEPLTRLLDEYRRMPFETDLVILSNIEKDLGKDVEVAVGLPSRNPWTLPFAHKRIFGERRNDYDLFIYSEDDTLITERNIEAFLRVTRVLPENEIAGFIRTEEGPDGDVYFSTVHNHYHWEVSSTRNNGTYSFAHFTNDHSAAFILTRDQLARAIASGGFLVPPHEGYHDLLVTAATDPYTQCGFKKMLCISHLEDFITPHLTNKYVGAMGVSRAEFYRQIERLRELDRSGLPRRTLFGVETRLHHRIWSKSYYEPKDPELLRRVPEGARSVLSIGCGSGETEGRLVADGKRVVALPLDAAIAVCAEERGVEIDYGTLEEVSPALRDQKFDCVLVSNVLHLVEDPVQVLRVYGALLDAGGRLVLRVPNLSQLPVLWRRVRGKYGYRNLGSFAASGTQVTGIGTVTRWLRSAGLRVESLEPVIPERFAKAQRLTGGLLANRFATDLIACARRA